MEYQHDVLAQLRRRPAMAPLLYSWLARMYNGLVRSSTQGDMPFETNSATGQVESSGLSIE
jgi:hypothetical protein